MLNSRQPGYSISHKMGNKAFKDSSRECRIIDDSSSEEFEFNSWITDDRKSRHESKENYRLQRIGLTPVISKELNQRKKRIKKDLEKAEEERFLMCDAPIDF